MKLSSGKGAKDDGKEFVKVTYKKPAYVCANNGKGCSVVLCFACFMKRGEMEKGGRRRKNVKYSK